MFLKSPKSGLASKKKLDFKSGPRVFLIRLLKGQNQGWFSWHPLKIEKESTRNGTKKDELTLNFTLKENKKNKKQARGKLKTPLEASQFNNGLKFG